jgi:hypothetical protein
LSRFNFQAADSSGTVIASASEAIQSNKQGLDCFVASAPRNDVAKRRHASAFSRHDAPELCVNICPKKIEGAGNAGCAVHPQPMREV